MIKQTFDIDKETIITLSPDNLPENYQVVWLIAPSGEKARSWITKTKVCLYAEDSKAMLLCLPGGKSNEFYTEKIWNEIQERYPKAGTGQTGRRLIGLNDGGVRVLDLVFLYPDKFFTAVAVCPKDKSNDKELIRHAEEYSKNNKDIPRLVIADHSEGQGRVLGDAINEYGFGMHIHDKRPCFGWNLADLEVSSCLAHIK